MIEIDITKRISTYKGGSELKVNTIFKSNGITKILGPSGVGKTTLLKIIAGLVTPEYGKITVNNVPWFDSSKKYSLKVQNRNVGFVFQDYALFPNMTVEQHLYYGTKDEQYIKQLLELGEMNLLKKNFPHQLSGGQQQRLAILRALSTKPELLLMDEPFSALDHQLKNKMISRIIDLVKDQKITVLLVTHNENEIEDSSIPTFTID